MAHHTERSALDQLMIFFNSHVHSEKVAECDDGPPAQKQSSDKEHHAGEHKASMMRQGRRRPMFCHINPRRHTHHDYEPHDAQRTPILFVPVRLRERRVTVSSNSEIRKTSPSRSETDIALSSLLYLATDQTIFATSVSKRPGFTYQSSRIDG